MPLSEDLIRDELSLRLDLLEPGLKLAGIEYHLPNENGARGFVDIVARDRTGMLVLVELKRSTASSRQAIQELLKYLALFVENHGIRRSQIRCLVVSTSWHELSAPFGEVVHSEAFQFEGFLLEVGPDGIPTGATPVEPMPPAEVELHQPYLFQCYEKEEQRDSVSSALLTFVRSRSGVHCIIVHQDYRDGDPTIIYPFGLTMCIASMGLGHGCEENDEGIGVEWDIINAAIDCAPFFPRDTQARGAFQFVASINGGWKPVRLMKAGLWEKSGLWSDEDLLRVVSGFELNNGIYLQFVGSPKNRMDWRQRLGQLAQLFTPDPPLRDLAVAILKNFAIRHPRGTVIFSAFYPEDLLLAVCSPVLTKDDNFSPVIEVFFLPPDSSIETTKIVRFMLCWDGRTRPRKASATIKAIYKSVLGYQVTTLMHEHFAHRAQTLSKLGLEWRAFETTGDNKNGHRITLSNGELIWNPLQQNSIMWLRPFVTENWNWVCDLASLIDPVTPKFNTPIGEETYFPSGPKSCDICARPLVTRIYDVSIPPHGDWGFLCLHCFNFLGCSLGWGVGQEFSRLSDDKWYLTQGGPDIPQNG